MAKCMNISEKSQFESFSWEKGKLIYYSVTPLQEKPI